MRPNYSHAIVIFSRCCGRWVSLDNLELEGTNWPLLPSQRKGSDITKTPWRISCLIDTKGSWRFIYTILGKDLGLLIDSSQLLTSPIGYQRLSLGDENQFVLKCLNRRRKCASASPYNGDRILMSLRTDNRCNSNTAKSCGTVIAMYHEPLTNQNTASLVEGRFGLELFSSSK